MGNILSKKEYAYTTGTLGTPTSTVNYAYDDSAWGDLLTGYGNYTIISDAIGNPTEVKQGNTTIRTYSWRNGRELASMTSGGTTWTFTYNADGIRTKRVSGGATYTYVYNGSSLSQMNVGNDTLYFIYDASGTPTAVVYNNTTYYYQTDLQGDVIAILNGSGAKVVEYTYDAWGKVLSRTGSMASTLGSRNPLRYRGYVYDAETALYYLQSRYYDPEMGRFINADALASTGQGLLGNNMFAYCNNAPVSNVDHSGKGPVAIGISAAVLIQMAKVAAVTAAIATAIAVVNKSAKQRQKSHTIYTLSDPETNQVVYVGRTTDFRTRMKAHSFNLARRNLIPTVLHEGLTYEQARAAEHALILYYSTLDKNNKSANQINGVNPNRRDFEIIMRKGFGISEAIDSVLTNKLLILFE